MGARQSRHRRDRRFLAGRALSSRTFSRECARGLAGRRTERWWNARLLWRSKFSVECADTFRDAKSGGRERVGWFTNASEFACKRRQRRGESDGLLFEWLVSRGARRFQLWPKCRSDFAECRRFC